MMVRIVERRGGRLCAAEEPWHILIPPSRTLCGDRIPRSATVGPRLVPLHRVTCVRCLRDLGFSGTAGDGPEEGRA